MDKKPKTDEDILEKSLEEKFMKLYPDYDYAMSASDKEKDTRKKKRMRTMY